MKETIGQIISKTRLQKNITLDQVYRALKIKERYLLAIEEDRLDDLPSRVQGRGFIRLYWEYLNLPTEDLDVLYDYSHGESSASKEGSQSIDGSSIQGEEEKDQHSGLIGNGINSDQEGMDGGKQSARLLREIGSDLMKQRKKLSLSLENIETITHIAPHYLQAMEDGRFDDLPSPVQGKGMLHNYAGFLDLNEDDILLRFAEALQLRREEALKLSDEKRNRKSFRLPRPGGMRKIGIGPIKGFVSIDILLIVILAAAAFVSLIWGVSSIVSYQMDPPATKTAQALIDALIQTATSASAATSSPTLEPTLTSTQEVLLANDAPTETIAPPVEAGSPVSIFIVANQRAYLQVIVDGATAFNGRVMPGTPYLFNGKAKVELISGNAAALQVLFNQQDLGVLGEQGEVVHLIFSINDFGTPTLTPSITPTVTLTPSRTLKPSNTYPPTRTKVPTSTQYPTRTRTPTRTPAQ